MQGTAQQWISTADAAAMLGVSQTAVRNNADKLGRKVLGRWQIDRSAVEALLSAGGHCVAGADDGEQS